MSQIEKLLGNIVEVVDSGLDVANFRFKATTLEELLGQLDGELAKLDGQPDPSKMRAYYERRVQTLRGASEPKIGIKRERE